MEEHALASSAFALKICSGSSNKLRLMLLLVLLLFSFLTRSSLSEIIFEERFEGNLLLSTYYYVLHNFLLVKLVYF